MSFLFFPLLPQSAYGVLSSIEGLDTFNDMCLNTPIGPWYYRVKNAVNTHAGAPWPLFKKK